MTLKLMPNESSTLPPPPDDASVLGRVLVVDDEAAIRTALSRFLRMRGFHAVPAASGAAALDEIASR